MKKAQDRIIEFKKELSNLLKKWNTEIEIETEGSFYNETSEMVCYLEAVYKGDKKVEEFAKVELGLWFAPEPPTKKEGEK